MSENSGENMIERLIGEVNHRLKQMRGLPPAQARDQGQAIKFLIESIPLAESYQGGMEDLLRELENPVAEGPRAPDQERAADGSDDFLKHLEPDAPDERDE